MENSQLFEFLPVLIMFAWMMVTPFVFPYDWQMRYMLNMVGMVVCISFMVMTTEVLKWKAAEFTHIDATCRPSGDRLHLFVTTIETAELEPGVYATQLTLGEKIEHSFYGPIEKGGSVVFKHELLWEERMQYGKRKAVFKGQVVDHAKSAKVILYEPPDTFDMDHLNPIPVFFLKEAPGDFNLPEDQVVMAAAGAGGLLTKSVITNDGRMTGAGLLFAYQNVKKENEQLKHRNVELQRQGLHWHQVAVRLEEVNKQIKNELHSVLSSKSDMKQSVVEQVLTLLEGHTKIRNALKDIKPITWFNKAAAMLIIGLIGIGVFLTNPGNIMGWLAVPQNQLFIIILSGVSVFFYVYALQKRKA